MSGGQDRSHDWFRSTFDEMYPVLYANRSHQEAVDFVTHLAERFSLRGEEILDLGCGTGRHLRALFELGARPVGLDLSVPLLLIAHDKSPLVPLVRGDMRRLPLRTGVFRAVLLMFTTFGYFRSHEEDLEVVREIARVLAHEGTLVLDYVNVPYLRKTLIARSGRLIREMCAEEKRWIEPVGPFLHKETRVGPMRDGSFRTYHERLRLYEREEIEAMLLENNLRIVARLGDYRGGEFDPELSPRFIVLAIRAGSARAIRGGEAT
jgi:SAM-dependent methyltransferase